MSSRPLLTQLLQGPLTKLTRTSLTPLLLCSVRHVLKTALDVSPHEFEQFTFGSTGVVDVTFALREFKVSCCSWCACVLVVRGQESEFVTL